MEKTEQDAFDAVVAHIRTQKYVRSVDCDGWCKYQGPGGLKCAIGALISDEHYSDDLDAGPNGDGWGWAAGEEVVLQALERSGWPRAVSLFGDLQEAHDEMGSAEDFETAAEEIAEAYGLTYARP